MLDEKYLGQEYQIIECPDCIDKGFVIKDKCKSCNSTHIGLWLNNIYFYWKFDLSPKHRKLLSLKDRINFIFNLIYFLTFIVLNVIWIVVYIYDYSENWSVLNFIKSNYFIYFLLSILMMYFLFYRLIKKYLDEQKVIKNKYFKKHKQEVFAFNIIEDFDKIRKVEISNSFTKKSIYVLFEAYSLANNVHHLYIEPLHLLASLSQNNSIQILFTRLGIKAQEFRKKIVQILAQKSFNEKSTPQFTVAFLKILLNSYLTAYEEKQEKVDVLDLFQALIETDYNDIYKEEILNIFEDLDVHIDKLKNVIQWMRIRRHLYEQYKRFHSLARFKPKGDVNRAKTSFMTKFLNMFSTDLTKLAIYGYLMPCINRKQEIEEIFRVIEGSNKSILLVGNKGVGRGTIINAIAQLMVTEDVPEILQDKRLVDLNLPHLIGGVDPAGAQERLLRILDEVIKSGNIVLSIKNIESMIGISTGGESSLDLSQILANALKNKSVFVLATTDPKSFSQFIEPSSLGQVFSVIRIEEMDDNLAIQVLESKINYIEAQNNVYFSYDALEKAVVLSRRYIHESFLPTKAIDIIEETAVYVKNNKDTKLVTGEDVAFVISNKTNIPLTALQEDETKKLLELENLIHQRIIGQDEAVKAVASSLRRARTELRDENRPIANFLFLGPTGVGKTELSKALADIYFGDEKNMVRFDMSEYQDKSSVDRLIGTLNSPGHLTEAIRKNPFSLLLLDELEKAHPDILNLFLQVMDDGRLTDGMGRTVDFTNVILIATSNAGTDYIQESLQKQIPIDIIKENLIQEKLKQYYRPEFLNRFDNIVIFTPLSFDQVVQITKLLLNKVKNRLYEKSINFEYTEQAVQKLAQLGYDPKFGARPLRRVLQEKVDNVLAEYILANKLKKHNTIILRDIDDFVIKE